MTANVYPARLASSGPQIGNPPSQVGGSALAGREWGKNGLGENQNVPGTAAGDVLGLESLVVDMRPSSSGYRYDVFASVNTFGLGAEGEDTYTMLVLGSTDGGSTFPIILAQTTNYEPSGAGLSETYKVSGDATNVINRVKMQLQRSVTASVTLTYAPPDACIVIREISPTS